MMRVTTRATLFLLVFGWTAMPQRAAAQLNAQANSVWLSAGFGGTIARNPSTRVAGWIGLSRFVVGFVRSDEEEFLFGPFERHVKGALFGLRWNYAGRSSVVVAAGAVRVTGYNDGGMATECFIFCMSTAVPVADGSAPAINVELDRGFFWITGGSMSIFAVGGHAPHGAIAINIRLGASSRANPR
jgi:hypothetical protein